MKVKPNHFINLSGKKEITRSNGVKYSIRNNRQRFFYPDEWFAFYDRLKLRKQKITFSFLINTGSRINEARNIKVSDVDFSRNSIVLRITKSRDKEGNRRIRVISCSNQFIRYIKKIINDYDLKQDDCFPILSTPASNICLKKALNEAGIKDSFMFSVHNIRKTLETWLLALGVDSMKVIKHFGHSFKIASTHYISPDSFSHEDRKNMRSIIGDLYER